MVDLEAGDIVPGRRTCAGVRVSAIAADCGHAQIGQFCTAKLTNAGIADFVRNGGSGAEGTPPGVTVVQVPLHQRFRLVRERQPPQGRAG